MGQKLSCLENHENDLLSAVQTGDVDMVKAMVEADPATLKSTTRYGKLSILHVAAIHGQIEVGSFFFVCLFLNRLWDLFPGTMLTVSFWDSFVLVSGFDHCRRFFRFF